MSELIGPVGDKRPPHGQERLIVLAILAVIFVVTLKITDDVSSAVAAVTALLGAATAIMGPAR